MGYISEHNKFVRINTLDDDIVQLLNKNVKQDCIELIENSYKKYLSDPEKIYSEEETVITAGIFDHIDNIVNEKELPFFIYPELPQFTKAIRKGIINPKKAKRYDLFFLSIQSGIRIKFGIEAKLLVEKNVLSKKATTLINEYVGNKGMGKFINIIYEDDGFMLGYILNGKVNNIVNKINIKVAAIYSTSEQLSKHQKHYLSSYFIQGNKKDLYHIFLDFSNIQ